MAALALGVVAWGEDRYDLVVATTMGLTTLSLMHIVAALEARELTGTIFSRYTIANRRFIQLIGAALVLTFLVTVLDALNRIFDTVPLTSSQWGICLLAALVFLAVCELGKLVDRRAGSGRAQLPASDSFGGDVTSGSAVAVANEGIRDHALRLLAGPVDRGALALAFSESSAASAEVLVEGASFYPRMLEDIASASSSIHINQFGFRPGVVGDAFADALIAKAAEGVSVRLVVDRQGSDPERSSRAFYERLTAAGIQVCVVRATKRARPRHARQHGRHSLEPGPARPRRPSQADGRGRRHRLGRRRRDRGPLPGRTLPRPVHPRTGPVVAQLQLVFAASVRWLGGELPWPRSTRSSPRSTPAHNRYRRSCCTTPLGAIARSPTRSRAARGRARDARRRQSLRHRPPDDPADRHAARRGVRVRLFVPGNANNWACAAAQQFHHAKLLDAGVRILEYPAMLHAKAFVRDGEELLAGTCNLEAWSLKRFFEIDLRLRGREVAEQFDERFSVPAEAVSSAGRRLTGMK